MELKRFVLIGAPNKVCGSYGLLCRFAGVSGGSPPPCVVTGGYKTNLMYRNVHAPYGVCFMLQSALSGFYLYPVVV